jgi:integrase
VLVLDEAVRDGLLVRNPAKDRARRRTVGRSVLPIAAPESPRDFALSDVGTLSRLVEEVVQRSGHQAWGDCVMILATTALRIGDVAGLQVGDVDLLHGLLTVKRLTYPGPRRLSLRRPRAGGRRPVPIIEPYPRRWRG